jgi:hypothetical protein
MPQGGVLSLAVLLPNVVWMLLPPLDAPKASNDVSRAWRRQALEWLEGASRGLVFAIPIFCDIDLRGPGETIATVVLGVALAFYYAAWVRYFTGGRQMRALYAPLLGVPVPLAVAPAVYFGAASVLLHSAPLAVAALALAVSHIPLSRHRARRLSRSGRSSLGILLSHRG